VINKKKKINRENEELNAIKSNFSELEISSFKLIGEGMDSKAYLLNDNFIFRFPKMADTSEKLEREIKILPLLKKVVTISMPEFIYTGVMPRTRYKFVGYRCIAGKAFEYDLFDNLGKDTKKVVEQIASFIKQVQMFPIDEAIRSGVETLDLKNKYVDIFEETKMKVYPLVAAEVKYYLEQLFSNFLGDEKNFKNNPVLLHGDLSPEHIFFDCNTNSILGIIDFGDICVGDPDYELRFLYKDYGIKFIIELLKIYPCHNRERLMAKLKFFLESDTVYSILHGIKRNNKIKVDQRLQELKNRAYKKDAS
jgi:aminoglycoside 2''-phosphotransferase